MTDNLPPLPETVYGLFYEDQTSDDEGYQVVLDEPAYTADQMRTYARAALAQAQSCVPAEPPFGSKRNAALALYRPPFKFLHGYIYDADGKMCADEGAMPEHVAARVRGWGRIGYMPDAGALQDEVGQMIAEALSAFWLAASPQPQPVHDEIAYKEAVSLATALFKKHFAHEEHYASGRVVWGPCDTTAGVISQIDNMVCGLIQPQPAQLQARIAELESQLAAKTLSASEGSINV